MESRTYGVFWDIENLVYEQEPELLPKVHETIRNIITAIPAYMSNAGYAPCPTCQLVFAKRDLPAVYVDLLRRHSYDVYLTKRRRKGAADGKFAQALHESLHGKRPPLPSLMIIITGDADFCQVASPLKRRGHTVWVLGWSKLHTSHALRRHAHRFITFQELFDAVHTVSPTQ